MRRRSWLISAFATAIPATSFAIGGPLIAAAASLQPALEEVAPLISAQTGIAPRFAYGASGNLVRQIAQGAPFEMLLAADEISTQKISEAGQARDAGHVFALGRLALFAPRGSALDPAAGLEALRPLLAAGRVQRFAIANPEHAPYGMRAEEALRRVGLWEQISSKLVYGENVSQTAQFALSGSTQGGIIAYSLALAPQIKAQGDFALIPEELHQPLAQRMVLMKNAPAAVKAFYEHLSTPAAQAVMVRYGFAMPKP